MKQEYINEIKAIIILAVGMIFLASLVSFVPDDLSWYTSSPNIPAQNLICVTGAYIAGSALFAFGYSSYALILFLFFWSWNKFCSREIKFSFIKFISFFVLFCVLSSFISMTGQQEPVIRFHRAGVTGMIFSDFLVQYLGRTGTYIILMMLGSLSFILSTEILVSPFFVKMVERIRIIIAAARGIMERKSTKNKDVKPPVRKVKPAKFLKPSRPKGIKGFFKFFGKKKEKKKKESEYYEEDIEDEEEEEVNYSSQAAEKKRFKKPKIRITPKEKGEYGCEGVDDLKIVGKYCIPSQDLLEDSPQIFNNKIQGSLLSGAKLLEESLSQFGVDARVVDIERGPAITRYELEPAPGVKVQKFTALSNDIALIMKAAAVRIVAPIPGKNRVGIEVPNGDAATVYLKDVLSSKQFRSSKSKLTLSLGRDIAGAAIIADLATMPHLLIAGTTGSGKTVCVNGIIMSILLNTTPDEVKMILIDPKMVELAQYNEIPHLLCPTVTNPQKASGALNWAVGEMESRYRKLSKEGVRNIKAYNAEGFSMPYIVIIVDELADLMQVSAKAVESSITRLAQLSRAVGIHLILATQRPSVDVITGIIKANFPARISFKVASKVDSRTVLDMNGAESLLGKGDMLFIQPGDAKPTRGQCSFVKDEEINNVVNFIKDQQEPSYDESVMKQQKAGGAHGSDQKDEYYDEAVRLVIETNQASVSILQRRMRLGYTRAARLIDMMEQSGVIGPYCGSKPRDILVDREQWLLENSSGQEVGE